MNKRLTTALMVLVAVGAVFAGALFLRARHTPDTSALKVGAIIPLTGDVATYGDSLRHGFDLAAEEFGGKVQVIYEDSKANPKDGVAAMQKLTGQGVRHFLGDATSGVCLAIAPLANETQSLLMISIATSDDLSKAGPWVFRNCPPNQKQAEAAATFMKDKLKVTRVAVLAKANPYGANLAAKFREDAASRGLQIVMDEQYDASVRNLSTLLEKVRAASPEAVFIPGNYEETVLILRKAKELGIQVPFVGTDGAYSPKLIELAGPAAEGFYLTMLGFDASSPFYKQFETRYRARYKADPDVFAAYGYEGAFAMFNVATVGGSLGKQREEFTNMNRPGLVGQIAFDVQGQVIRPVGVMKIQQGEFVLQ